MNARVTVLFALALLTCDAKSSGEETGAAAVMELCDDPGSDPSQHCLQDCDANPDLCGPLKPFNEDGCLRYSCWGRACPPGYACYDPNAYGVCVPEYGCVGDAAACGCGSTGASCGGLVCVPESDLPPP